MFDKETTRKVKFVGDSRIIDKTNDKKRDYPKDYSEFPGKSEPFWPNFLLKEWMVGAVVLFGFLVLTVSHEPPLQTVADPTDTDYLPVPDWYFFFLYELLKYTYASGPYTVIGALIIPGLGFGALMLAPWLDPGPERRWFKRPVASGLMFATILSIFVLTYYSVDAHNWEQEERYAFDSEFEEVTVDTDHEGYDIYASSSCIDCHGEQLEGAASGPAIFDAGAQYDADEIEDIIINGIGSMPADTFDGTDEEREILAEWLAEQDGEGNGDGGEDDDDDEEDDDEEDDAA